MAKRNRKNAVDVDSKNFVKTIKRRERKDSQDPRLARLQRKIRQTTESINDSESTSRDSMVRELERAIERAQDYDLQVNLQSALDRYRKQHVKSDVRLVDLSEYIRDEEEARVVLEKLDAQTDVSRTIRMRQNYDKALRKNGYTELADTLLGLSDRNFLLGYYAQPNANQIFELYTLTADDARAAIRNWEDIIAALGLKVMGATRARNKGKYNPETGEVKPGRIMLEQFLFDEEEIDF